MVLNLKNSNHLQTFLHTSNSYFIYIEEVILSPLMKIIELHKVYEFEIFSNEIQIFSKPPFFKLEEVMLSSL